MLKRGAHPLIGLAALLGSCTTAVPDVAPSMMQIGISAVSDESWSASYILPEPASELVFARQPDDSRARHWVPAPGFEIVRSEGAERLRRTDGAPFREATVAVPPLYRDLPMDYAPFSPFGDGGRLVFTGRFFACPGVCADDETWQLTLDAPGRSILVDGQLHRSRALWTDGDSGRNVYVGETAPVETPDFLAVIDTALPASIREQLAKQLPGFMQLFAERLGALPERPMLFASYDIAHADGWGRQGGTLPGQVFVHFYGSAWPEQMAKPGFADDLAWHFAHEAAHLYQHQIFINGEGAWIHEGGAEALAAIALRLQGQEAAAAGHTEASDQSCRRLLGSRSIRAALAAGEYQVAYACGLQVQLALDTELRNIAPTADGLFTVWNRYRDRVSGKTATEEDFFLAIADVGGPTIAASVRKLVDTPLPASRSW